MITNIRLELSDLARNDLAKRLDRDPVTKRLVTRKEVTELVEALINDEARKGWQDEEVQPVQRDDDQRSAVPRARMPEQSFTEAAFVPSRGDEPYLYKPSDPELAAKLSALLDDSRAFEEYVWKQLEANRSRS